MSEQPNCQSCSRPINGMADFGTEADGSYSTLYCSCCYAKGTFTEPDVTMDQMVERVFGIVTEYKIMAAEEARQKLPALFRGLARWRA